MRAAEKSRAGLDVARPKAQVLWRKSKRWRRGSEREEK
jgi:hypothetical protein